MTLLVLRVKNRRNSFNEQVLGQLCAKCLEKSPQAHKDSREAIWSDLQKVYGIGGTWAELTVSESNAASHLWVLSQAKNTASR
jgi:hypothetical protein